MKRRTPTPKTSASRDTAGKAESAQAAARLAAPVTVSLDVRPVTGVGVTVHRITSATGAATAT
jgi:hypothetical protein